MLLAGALGLAGLLVVLRTGEGARAGEDGRLRRLEDGAVTGRLPDPPKALRLLDAGGAYARLYGTWAGGTSVA